MNPLPSDAELLRRYSATGAGDDLSVLVQRYVDLVYSAARRQMRDADAAQDVTQQVFIVLLRKGRRLGADTVLASWLLKVTALECRNYKRGEARRVRRERKVAQMTPEVGPPPPPQGGGDGADPNWNELAPHVDAALGELSAGDREAVVLRYFLNRSYGEAAAALGASEGSVRQRVHRGLGKIRAVLSARGVIATEGALTAALLAHAVERAPAGVGAATIAAVGKASGISTSGVVTIMSATSPLKFGLAATFLLLVVGFGVLFLLPHGNGGRASGTAPRPSAATTASTAQGASAPVAEPVALPAAPQPAPAAAETVAPPRKVFDVIAARTCDARQGPRDGFDHLSFINRGDWVEYDNVEFPPAETPHDMVFCAVIACPAQFAGNDIEVHVGAPDGPTIATLTVEPTAGYGDFVCQETPVHNPPPGRQDIFLVFSTGGGFNVRSIKFAVIDGRPADERIVATGYTMAKRVNEGNKTLVQVRNGAWARYDWVQFPADGADTFSLSYAVDGAHAGGTVSVRLDLPTSAPICEIPIVSTGGYSRFYTRTVALSRKVAGNHDVYLTFAGQDRGYFGLADVSWFMFHRPGTAQLTPPPPQPATQATTRAATTTPTTAPAFQFRFGR